MGGRPAAVVMAALLFVAACDAQQTAHQEKARKAIDAVLTREAPHFYDSDESWVSNLITSRELEAIILAGSWGFNETKRRLLSSSRPEDRMAGVHVTATFLKRYPTGSESDFLEALKAVVENGDEMAHIRFAALRAMASQHERPTVRKSLKAIFERDPALLREILVTPLLYDQFVHEVIWLKLLVRLAKVAPSEEVRYVVELYWDDAVNADTLRSRIHLAIQIIDLPRWHWVGQLVYELGRNVVHEVDVLRFGLDELSEYAYLVHRACVWWISDKVRPRYPDAQEGLWSLVDSVEEMLDHWR